MDTNTNRTDIDMSTARWLDIVQAGYEMRGVDIDMLDEIFIGLDDTLIVYQDGNSLNLDYNNVTLDLDIVNLLLGLNGQGVYVFANQYEVDKGVISFSQLLDKLLLISSLLEEHGVEYVIKRFYLAIAETESVYYEPFNTNISTITDSTYSGLPSKYLFEYHKELLHEEDKEGSRIFIGSQHYQKCADEYLFSKNCETSFVPKELVYLLSD